MASSFKSVDLLGSGPHRFSTGPLGQQVVLRLQIGQTAAGSISLGGQELTVTVRGRLAAESDSTLQDALDAIQSQLDNWATAGVLVDHHGRSWDDMKFVSFTPDDRIDRGREVSLGYTARFIRF